MRQRFGGPSFLGTDAVEEIAGEIEIAQTEEVGAGLRELREHG